MYPTRRQPPEISFEKADFPIRAIIKELDFSPYRGLDRRLILEMAQWNWVLNMLNVLILGLTGSGKTYLSCAFGTAAACCGFSVLNVRASRLLHMLSQSRQDGSYASLQRSPWLKHLF